MRQGLRSLLEREPDIEVIAEAENGRSAVHLAQTLGPDVVIMDIGMPDLNGIDATRKIVAKGNSTKVIALSMHSNQRFVAGMFNAGASGYVMKENAFEDLVRAIRTVLANQPYLSTKLTNMVIRDYIRRLPSRLSVDPPLTSREREVLQLLAEGKSTKQIASHLSVSVKTVETYRRHIMQKLSLHSIAELTKYAIREGITSLEI